MDIELRSVGQNEWEALRNLWEKYDYDTSWFSMRDVNDEGLYENEDFNFYYSKDKKWCYFITVDKKIAGFVLITDFSVINGIKIDFQISEFFVMKKYCRSGVGRHAFSEILNRHKGKLQVVCHPKNTIGILFWNKIIDEYTNGKYEAVSSAPDFLYSDSTPGKVFIFNT